METIQKYILTVVLGVVSGFLGGGLGLGISTLALPGFILLNLVPNVKTAIGTTLVSSPASWPSVYRYYKSGNVDLTLGVIYFICYFICSYFGANFFVNLTAKTLNVSISIIHFLLAVYFLYRALH